MKLIVVLVAVAACGNPSRPSSPMDAAPGSDGPVDGSGGTIDTAPYEGLGVGNLFVCAIRQNGELWCWGDNADGQLGVGHSAGVQLGPTRIGTDRWTALSSSEDSTCAIKTDHSMWCWGSAFSSLGFPQDPIGTTDSSMPTRVDGDWQAVSLQHDGGCGLHTDGTVWCWPHAETQLPKLVDSAPSLSVSMGLIAACSIHTDHSLWCWQLGQDQLIEQSGPDTWSVVSVGNYVVCAVTTAGTLRCWGHPVGSPSDTQPQLQPTPVLVDGIDGTDWRDVRVSLAGNNACASRADHSLWCWGRNDHSQSGSAVEEYLAEPTLVSGGFGTWSTSASARELTCALGTDHSIWCVGNNGRGQHGDAGAGRTSPTRVPGTHAQVVTGRGTTCVIDDTGAAACAGENASGTAGDGTYHDRRNFVAVAQTASLSSIDGAFDSMCGLTSAGALWCWGSTPGAGSVVENKPTQVAGTWAKVSANFHSCAIDAAGHVSCWGSNGYGEAGCSMMTNAGSRTPIVVDSTRTWSELAAGINHTCGISSEGTMCWGAGSWGQRGDGSTSLSECSPVAVSGGVTFTKLAAGAYHTCGIATDGHAYCWGHDANGQLGDGATADSATPKKIVSPLFRAIAGGWAHTCGIATDGSLWCWGLNTNGQLGDGTQIDRSTPTRIGVDVDWAAVSTGDYTTCATKADHSVWCWGSNNEGQLGDGAGWSDSLVQVQLP